MEQESFDFAGGRRIWTVSGLLLQLRQSLDREFFDVWIEGEVSNFHQAVSKHCYFSLKDGQGQIKAALFAPQARYLKFRLRDGMQVVVRGRLSLYEARGELQCTVEQVEPVGLGGLRLAFEQLKEKLEREGLFRAERKRPLPALPRCIGLVTSARGAAVADIIHTLRRRFANLNIRLYPVAVQGENAAGEICRALEYFASAEAAVDLVILARGGGSIEDLWPFNEEAVARAVARMPMPIITGIGHETDFTIADFVADVRAPTPTAAAELAVRAKVDLEREVASAAAHLRQALRYRLAQRAQRMDELGYRLLRAEQGRLHLLQRRLTAAAAQVRSYDVRGGLRAVRARTEAGHHRLLAAWGMQASRRRHRLEALTAVLEERNPLGILRRGYALVYDGRGRLASGPEAFADGDPLRVRFAAAWLDAEARKRP